MTDRPTNQQTDLDIRKVHKKVTLLLIPDFSESVHGPLVNVTILHNHPIEVIQKYLELCKLDTSSITASSQKVKFPIGPGIAPST